MILRIDWLIAAGVAPEVAEQWVEPLDTAMQEFRISATSARIGMFLAQITHESNGLKNLVENLNYSAERLMAVWNKRFPTLELAKQYEHQPEKLANFVYANRLGNGDVDSGDGWRYRGRGPIQITGRNNYIATESRTKIECVKFPELLELPKYGAKSAASYWSVTGLNALADAGNFDRITVKINGGLVGNADRHKRWSDVQVAIGSH